MSSSSDIQPAGTGTYTSDNLPAITGNTYFNLTYFKWSVATASGASYGFTRDDSTGYWKSTNAGVNSSASVSVVTVVLPVAATITVNYINYAEATYDYGIIGTLGATLDTTNTADSSNVALSMKTSTYNVSTEQTFSFDKQAAGTYTFYIKYRKDGSVNSNNDSLQFKLTFS
jgi:hypothetical protein